MNLLKKYGRWAVLLCVAASFIACADDTEENTDVNPPEESNKEGPPDNYDGPYLDADDVLEIWRSPVRGNPDALVTIVGFEEFNCGHCKDAQPVLDDVLDAYADDARFVFKHFPLENAFPQAYPSAFAARAAFAQGEFWAYHDALFEHQADLDSDIYTTLAEGLDLDLDAFEDERQSERVQVDVAADRALGQTLGVASTPVFFVNGQRLPSGATLEEDFAPAIEAERDAMQELLDNGATPEEALKNRLEFNREQN